MDVQITIIGLIGMLIGFGGLVLWAWIERRSIPSDEEPLKTGDTVRLRSGGRITSVVNRRYFFKAKRNMTVTRVWQTGDVECDTGSGGPTVVFPPNELKKVK